MQRDEAIQTFRTFVLEALDRACDETFGAMGTDDRKYRGWIDGDLQFLFPPIDRQVEELAERYGVDLIETE